MLDNCYCKCNVDPYIYIIILTFYGTFTFTIYCMLHLQDYTDLQNCRAGVRFTWKRNRQFLF